MKILLLCWRDTSHPQGGGSERYLERVGEYLSACGHEVTFRTACYPGSLKQEQRGGITFSRAGGRFSVYPRALLWLWRRRFDVVVDTQNGIPFFARLATRAPVVVLSHHCHREQWLVTGRLLGRVGWWLESKVAPFVYRNAQWVTVSEPSAAELRALGVRRVAIIRNGVDRVDASAAQEPFRMVTLSRLVPHKHIEHAIDAVRAIPEAHLDVIGSGWWSDRLRAYAADVADRVHFHGHVSERRKHELLARACLHLMPSAKEGWGLAVIEAGLHGVPTIGYRSSGGLRDSVRGGLLVDTHTDFLAATRLLLFHAQRRQTLGAIARDYAQQFSWEETGRRFMQIIGTANQEKMSAQPKG